MARRSAARHTPDDHAHQCLSRRLRVPAGRTRRIDAGAVSSGGYAWARSCRRSARSIRGPDGRRILLSHDHEQPSIARTGPDNATPRTAACRGRPRRAGSSVCGPRYVDAAERAIALRAGDGGFARRVLHPSHRAGRRPTSAGDSRRRARYLPAVATSAQRTLRPRCACSIGGRRASPSSAKGASPSVARSAGCHGTHCLPPMSNPRTSNGNLAALSGAPAFEVNSAARTLVAIQDTFRSIPAVQSPPDGVLMKVAAVTRRRSTRHNSSGLRPSPERSPPESGCPRHSVDKSGRVVVSGSGRGIKVTRAPPS